MNTLMIGKRYPVVSSVMVLVIMALLGTMLGAVPPLSIAGAQSVDKTTIGDWVVTEIVICGAWGGVSTVIFDFDSSGNIESAITSCHAGHEEGPGTCFITETGNSCALTQAPESIAPDLPDIADPGANPRYQTSVPDQNTAPPVGVAEDPTRGEGVTMEIAASPEEQVAGCETLGGIGTIIDNRGTATIDVHCSGGVLDGMVCRNGHYQTDCTYYRVTTDPAILGGVTPDALPELIEIPEGTGPLVVMKGTNDPDATAAGQQMTCALLGGTAEIEQNYIGGPPPIYLVDVRCTGGLLDGMECANGESGWLCGFSRPLSPASQHDTVTPGEAEDVPAAPPPTAQPTQVVDANLTPTPTTVPTMEPTASPTDVPVEPTVMPTTVPPQPPRNDNSVPPGESIEPVEPTPTPVILT
jgi:hypothetical protein